MTSTKMVKSFRKLQLTATAALSNIRVMIYESMWKPRVSSDSLSLFPKLATDGFFSSGLNFRLSKLDDHFGQPGNHSGFVFPLFLPSRYGSNPIIPNFYCEILLINTKRVPSIHFHSRVKKSFPLMTSSFESFR